MKLDPLSIWIQCLLIFGALCFGGPRWAGGLAALMGLGLLMARMMEGRR